MKVSISCHMQTAEVGASVNQMVATFGAIMETLAAARADFVNIAQLSIGTTIRHPASGIPTRGRRSYSRAERTYFVEESIDYGRWVTPEWTARTEVFADTVRHAITRVPGTRITDEERATLISLIEHARWSVRQKPPPKIVLIKPILLAYSGDETSPSQISFDSTVSGQIRLGRVVEVRPEEAMSVARVTEPSESEKHVSGFKLYLRVDGHLHYNESWHAEREVVEHWGVCGERGDIREYAIVGNAGARKIIQKLKREARLRGFRSIPRSRHATLVVEYLIDGFGGEDDLKRRHALEEFLNQQTGWLGLGHCDGGSSGAGSMDVFCVVVDFRIAKLELSRKLEKSPFGVPSKIYRMK